MQRDAKQCGNSKTQGPQSRAPRGPFREDPKPKHHQKGTGDLLIYGLCHKFKCCRSFGEIRNPHILSSHNNHSKFYQPCPLNLARSARTAHSLDVAAEAVAGRFKVLQKKSYFCVCVSFFVLEPYHFPKPSRPLLSPEIKHGTPQQNFRLPKRGGGRLGVSSHKGFASMLVSAALKNTGEIRRPLCCLNSRERT